MRTAALLLTLAPAMFSQEGFGDIFSKASPEVEKALREKIEFFYQAHKDGKYRQADQVVHEDSKDIFFNAERFTCRDFKVVQINYSADFQKATVVADIDTDYFLPGFKKVEVHRPMTSFWKQADGQWWWYVDPEEIKRRQSFAGSLTPGEGGTTDPRKALESMMQSAPNPGALMNMVRADKTEVSLLSHAPSEAEVSIENAFDGPVTLRMIAYDAPNLVITLNKTRLEPKEKAILKLVATPQYPDAKKPDTKVDVYVEELSKLITVQVKYEYPPAAVKTPKP